MCFSAAFRTAEPSTMPISAVVKTEQRPQLSPGTGSASNARIYPGIHTDTVWILQNLPRDSPVPLLSSLPFLQTIWHIIAADLFHREEE
uniref:Uncharacterized protein n=1 Tax=Knipowitschia caucasica TaxID=637954 RepID=A0AAV2LTU3_KNICA